MNTEDVRLAVYECFARRGVAPSVQELSGIEHATETDVRAALRQLAEQRHLVLDERGDIVMAHPFSAVPLGFSVMGEKTLWWGGCAWDSFALPHLLTWESELLVATRCPACDAPHAWSVGRSAPPPGEQVAHFLTPAARMWDDIVQTCGHQRIFCSTKCVTDWLAATKHAEGYVMALPTLWRLASRWYEGRLDRGYRRRDPIAATDYMRDVGLSGPFWGL